MREDIDMVSRIEAHRRIAQAPVIITPPPIRGREMWGLPFAGLVFCMVVGTFVAIIIGGLLWGQP